MYVTVCPSKHDISCLPYPILLTMLSCVPSTHWNISTHTSACIFVCDLLSHLHFCSFLQDFPSFFSVQINNAKTHRLHLIQLYFVDIILPPIYAVSFFMNLLIHLVLMNLHHLCSLQSRQL